jgi:hypothetical protein
MNIYATRTISPPNRARISLAAVRQSRSAAQRERAGHGARGRGARRSRARRSGVLAALYMALLASMVLVIFTTPAVEACEQTLEHSCAAAPEAHGESLISGECGAERKGGELLSSPQRRGTRGELPRALAVRPLPDPVVAPQLVPVPAPLHLRPRHAQRNGTRAPQRC